MKTTLGKMVAATFKAPVPRRADPFRKARKEARALAEKHGVQIERLRGGGFNVWPPKGFVGNDPHEGDHFANDWNEVLPMVRAYVPT